MSTHKHFYKICCVVLALTLILTVLFMNAGHFGIQKASTVMGYEKTLFDTSKVHTINIIMDDWDEFTANCKSEEYYTCTVVIDNEAFKNAAIRGKGNTSLTQVESYGNGRYSFKIEFDHYDSSQTYHGLDKLCLNNVIQDNTYMKDYLTYQMMNKMGVASPLCCYTYITVNGEDWGLYLAVEGLEESFLQRNYGKDYGELYKPDSMSMGGGRGNGEKFDMDEFLNESESESADTTGNDQSSNNGSPFPQMPGGQMPDTNQGGQMPGGFGSGQMPGGMTPPSGDIGGNFGGQMPGGMTPPDETHATVKDDMGGGMRNGSDDVLLRYIDDSIESYSNIFENAKTDITKADKNRLINALEKLGNGEDLESTVDIDAVIRYFVVHNFVVNFDSYTGSMIHNYYLYEKDGQLQMLPWDYNLAFGGFQSMGGVTSLVNYPIDSPVSGGNAEERPMIAWIFANGEYTELYHQYFAEFISEYFDSGYFSEMIDKVKEMISPYVEKDPTKFCTFEEFEKGITTLKEFCLLRAESVSAQLEGTIGSTSDTQKSDTLIDAGDVRINDMGSMGNAMGGKGDPDDSTQNPQTDINEDVTGSTDNIPSGGSDTAEDDSLTDIQVPHMPDGQMPVGDKGGFGGQMQKPDEGSRPGNVGQMQPQGQSTASASSWIAIGASFMVLTLGLIFAFTFKRRKI